MNERLIIQNFAGLNVDIELGRINIFIGPQASGKSVCAKLLYFFKDVFINILQSAEDGQTISDLKEHLHDYFLRLFDITTIHNNFLITYTIEEESIEVRYLHKKLVVEFSSYYLDIYKQCKLIVSSDIGFSVPFTDRLEKELVARAEIDLHPFAGAWQLFIPASRAIFSVLENYNTVKIPSFLEDPLFSQFERLYRSIQRNKLRQLIPVERPIQNLVKKVLKATLIGDEKAYFLQQANGQVVKIQQSSSGQQEILPLLLLLEYLSSEKSPNLKSVVYIEEPETHLFSESQRILAHLLAQVYQQRGLPIQYIITTHSPYLLASFNNLVYAHQLAQTLRDQPAELQQLYQVVPLSQQLPLADFRVYGFEKGSAHSLINIESGLLSADLLDSASDVTADQFTALMALDPATHP